MTREEAVEKVKQLAEERCDCVLSVRMPSTCRRCWDLMFYTELLKDWKDGEELTEINGEKV